MMVANRQLSAGGSYPQQVVVYLTILSLRFDPRQAQIRLTTVSFSSILHSSSLAVSNNLTSHFWRIYEMGFPECYNMKAPGEFRSFLGGLSSLIFLKIFFLKENN
jgi:hypothetical protein